MIKKESAEADVVVNVGDSDAVGVVRAVLETLNGGTNGRGRFVQVSGAANFLDGSTEGVYKEGRVWDVSGVQVFE